MVMPRVNGKAKKIAFAILGTPSNIIDKRTTRQKMIDRKVMYDNTQRVR
jgi:hypothetical protein